MSSEIRPARIFMAELGIYTEDTATSIGTDGLISCIGFAGWSRETRTGFLAHLSTPEQVEDFYKRGITQLKIATSPEKPIEFSCKVVGGWERARYSRKIREFLFENPLEDELVNLKIIEDSPPISCPTPRSLSVNLSDGSFGEYTPSPTDRSLSTEDADYYLKHVSIERLRVLTNTPV